MADFEKDKLIQIPRPELGRPTDPRLTPEYIAARPELERAGYPAFDPTRDIDYHGYIEGALQWLQSLASYATPEVAAQVETTLAEAQKTLADTAQQQQRNNADAASIIGRSAAPGIGGDGLDGKPPALYNITAGPHAGEVWEVYVADDGSWAQRRRGDLEAASFPALTAVAQTAQPRQLGGVQTVSEAQAIDGGLLVGQRVKQTAPNEHGLVVPNQAGGVQADRPYSELPADSTRAAYSIGWRASATTLNRPVARGGAVGIEGTALDGAQILSPDVQGSKKGIQIAAGGDDTLRDIQTLGGTLRDTTDHSEEYAGGSAEHEPTKRRAKNIQGLGRLIKNAGGAGAWAQGAEIVRFDNYIVDGAGIESLDWENVLGGSAVGGTSRNARFGLSYLFGSEWGLIVGHQVFVDSDGNYDPTTAAILGIVQDECKYIKFAHCDFVYRGGNPGESVGRVIGGGVRDQYKARGSGLYTVFEGCRFYDTVLNAGDGGVGFRFAGSQMFFSAPPARRPVQIYKTGDIEISDLTIRLLSGSYGSGEDASPVFISQGYGASETAGQIDRVMIDRLRLYGFDQTGIKVVTRSGNDAADDGRHIQVNIEASAVANIWIDRTPQVHVRMEYNYHPTTLAGVSPH